LLMFDNDVNGMRLPLRGLSSICAMA